MATMIRFLRQPERGQISRVPFSVGAALIRGGEAEDASVANLPPLVDAKPVPVLKKAVVVASKTKPRTKPMRRTTKGKRK